MGRPENGTYTWVNLTLHWLTLPLLVSLLGIGWYMVDLPLGMDRFELINLHKSIGILLLCLTLVRIIYRSAQSRQKQSQSGLSDTLAKAAHALLYVCLLGLPITGWLMSNTAGFEVELFGHISLPTLMTEDEAFSGQLSFIHELQVWLLCVLLVGHIFAAFWHHWVLGDDTLTKMIKANQ